MEPAHTASSQKAAIYKNHENGFYVYSKQKKCDSKSVTKYTGHYLGRPVTAASRIDSYDGENVTFHYSRHEDDVLVSKTQFLLSEICTQNQP